MKRLVVLFALISLLSGYLSAQYTISPKMEWWYKDRFGMFIHFGSYSEYGKGEWVQFVDSIPKEEYQTKITQNFNPENFNAEEIVSLAKKAGMKYIVITAKHHEGFAMWKTNAKSFKDYTGKKTFDLYHYLGFKRDLLMELKQECEKQGIVFGLYYSILDWNHPSQEWHDYFSRFHDLKDKPEYVADMKVQLKEIIERYNPKILWFDGDWCKDTVPINNHDWWNKADAVDLYNYVMSLDSTIIVNERVKRNLGLGDFMCPEEKIPAKPMPRQWETCQTMNGSWGYKESLENSYRSVDTLIHELEAIVSRDGNYLLNIGPKGDGSISPIVDTIFTAIGEWMSIYSESIYGTGRNPFGAEPDWGYYTTKGDAIYVHVNSWPKDGKLLIPYVDGTYTKAYELSQADKTISFKKALGGIVLNLPELAPNQYSSVIKIEFSR